MIEDFDLFLHNYLQKSDIVAPILKEAVAYSLFNGGKRVRPQFVFFVGELFEAPFKKLFPIAAAIEMIHAFSLIHDDLPAMDDDDLRRGKPTNHKVFGEDLAILAGDALSSLALRVLIDEGLSQNYPSSILPKLSQQLTKATTDMICGQVFDIGKDHPITTLSQLKQMHLLKTGALIQAALVMPATLLTRDKQQQRALKQYAKHIGLAFQIKDDLLDVEGSATQLGKTPQKDIENNKSTFVTIMGLKKAKELLAKETTAAVASLEIFGKKGEGLADFSRYLLERVN